MMKKYHLLISIIYMLTACAVGPKKISTEKVKVDPPKLLKPVVRKIWIPPEIKNGGTEWVEGHYMFRIEKETSWSR